jgi:2-polyprenyl-3-methyl-5-hydroxy-6-metoxy-1,4-benzoquinol methylase
MFYKNISTFYDYIFPKNPQQLNFLESIRPISKDEKILDIGCATGNLTSLIYEKNKEVIGLDLDEDLLDIAKDKNPHIKFLAQNMLELDSFGPESFDRIVSFGNTLVHLDNQQTVKAFFEKVHKALKDTGHFTVQIINYDYIYDHNVHELPLIDNDMVTFERYYDLYQDHVDFKSKLLIKSTGQSIKNLIPLLNLKKSFLETCLKEVGFSDITFYGNFKGQPLADNSLPLVFNCKK